MDIRPIASGSSGNAYHLRDETTQVLVECGLRWPAIRQALAFRTSDLDGCLISHEHGDHAKSVRDVIRAGIDCYMTAKTAAALNVTGHRVHHIDGQFTVGQWTVRPFRTIHDAADPVGFLIAAGSARVLYATDTAYLPNRFKGLTHVMVECNYDGELLRENVAAGQIHRSQQHRQLWSHMRLDTVLEFLRKTDLSACREIWLLHLSSRNADAERFKKAVQRQTGIVCRIGGTT